MNVKELIEHLSKLDPELIIYTAIDAEGNGYNRLDYEPEVRFIFKSDVGDYKLDHAYDQDDWNAEVDSNYIDASEVPAKIVII